MSAFDRAVAPGATRDEIALSVTGAAVGAILAAALAWRAAMSPLVVVLMTMAADGFGGVVVNARAATCSRR